MPVEDTSAWPSLTDSSLTPPAMQQQQQQRTVQNPDNRQPSWGQALDTASAIAGGIRSSTPPLQQQHSGANLTVLRSQQQMHQPMPPSQQQNLQQQRTMSESSMVSVESDSSSFQDQGQPQQQRPGRAPPPGFQHVLPSLQHQQQSSLSGLPPHLQEAFSSVQVGAQAHTILNAYPPPLYPPPSMLTHNDYNLSSYCATRLNCHAPALVYFIGRCSLANLSDILSFGPKDVGYLRALTILSLTGGQL